MTHKEINALVSLLDEHDEGILTHVQSKIISLGREAIYFLENLWDKVDTPMVVQERVEGIVHKIQLNVFEADIKVWAIDGNSDLLDGVFIVNSILYPDFDALEIRENLEAIKHQIWLELSDKLTSFEKVKILNHFFFNVEGFKPNREDYHAPDNSMMNMVMKNRTGNPLSLAILYLHIARRLEMPVYGINTPNHFLLAWVAEVDPSNPFAEEDDEQPEVLFYINPFSNGAILQKQGIDTFLSHNNVNKDKAFYLPCDEMAIIKRLLNNLKYSFEKNGDKVKCKDLEYLLQMLASTQSLK